MVDAQRSRSRVVARLVAVATTVLALAAGAHVAGSGAVPHPGTVGALALPTLAVAGLLARHRLRVVTLLPAVAVWQLVLHHGFATASPVPVPATPGPHPGHAAHVPAMGPHAATHLPDAALPDAALPDAALAEPQHAALAMLLAHVLGTALTVALLVATERGADRALARLAWALPVLGGRVATVVVGRPRVARATDRTTRPTVAAWVRGPHGSRAPPRGLRTA